MALGQTTAAASLVLARDPRAAHAARAFTRTVLADWELSGVLDDVVLVVSELVTNAVRYGEDPVELSLHRNGAGLRVDVADAVPPPPRDMTAAPGPPDTTAESGRGLDIVRALSHDCGWSPVPHDGKVAFATFRL